MLFHLRLNFPSFLDSTFAYTLFTLILIFEFNLGGCLLFTHQFGSSQASVPSMEEFSLDVRFLRNELELGLRAV